MKNNVLSILLATTFLSTSAMAITLEPTLENSAISYSEGNSSDYNFTVQEADTDGNLTTKYYKIDIDKDKISTSSSISWTALDSKPNDMTNVVEIKLPNNQAKYFKYTYTTPNGYTTASTQINDTLSSADVTDIVFKNITSTSNGGAIYNAGDNSSINIKADFIGNYVSSRGSAIYNYAEYSEMATIGNITGDFIGNYTSSGGTIYNYADYGATAIIGNITGDFISNHTSSGGAIYNRSSISGSTATIGDITGDFIGNYADTGGAISNYASNSTATIGNIIGDFIGNYAEDSFNAYGGAVYNSTAKYSNSTATIGDIIGDFIGNYASTTSYYASGGAIYNFSNHQPTYTATATIGNITSDFIGNYANGSYVVSGGAIYNCADDTNARENLSSTVTIGDITGDFVGNYVYATGSNGWAYGGAIYNYAGGNGPTATIGDITGDFIGNYASSNGKYAYGGAIYNAVDISNSTATIGNIIGDFIGNYAEASSSVYGGAVYNGYKTTIGNITGDFIGNYVYATGSYSSASGGAIYNGYSDSLINKLSGEYFAENKAISFDGGAKGGFLYNKGTIKTVEGNIINNEAQGKTSALGGAIYHYVETEGNISNIDIKSENIFGNKAISTDGIALGGFFYGEEYGIVGNISGNIYNNEAQGKSAGGGAIYSSSYSDITKIEVTVDNDPNYVIGPVYLTLFAGYTKTQNLTDVNFDSNKAVATDGDAIGGAIAFYSSLMQGDNVSSDEFKDEDGNIYGPDGNIITLEEFVKLYTDLIKQELGGFATYEEALASIGGVDQKSFEITNATFTNNVVQADYGVAKGGAIANGVDGIITNGSFTNNKAIGQTALGGAIYNSGDLTIAADNYQSVFSGNMANDKDNAIYNSCSSTLLLSAINGGEIIFNDGIDGDKGYKLTVEGDGEVIVNSTIENVGELNINGGNFTISSAKSNQERRVVLSSISDKTASYSFNKINMVGGNLNFANLVIDEIKTSGLSSDNGTLHIDVDPVKMTSDKLSVDGNVEGTTKLVVHAASNNDLNGKIVFAESVNDSTGNEKSFEISRVYKSPYMYEVKHQSSAENEHEWYFGTGTEENPDYQPLGPIEVAPEIIGFEALQSAGLSQTNGMVYNIMRKVGVNRLFCPGCGFYDYN